MESTKKKTTETKQRHKVEHLDAIPLLFRHSFIQFNSCFIISNTILILKAILSKSGAIEYRKFPISRKALNLKKENKIKSGMQMYQLKKRDKISRESQHIYVLYIKYKYVCVCVLCVYKF